MKSKPRILFINRSYWPDTEATGQLLTELCEGLTGDFQVEVLAGLPNHVSDSQINDNTGEVIHNGVRITYLLHTRFPKSSTLGRALNLISFTLAAFWSTLWRPRPDVVVTETDPFFLPMLGKWLKRRFGCKFVAYLQDIYPDVALAVGATREGWITAALRQRLQAAYRAADRIVVLSDDMRDRCVRNGAPADSLAVIHNWADCRRVRPLEGTNDFAAEHLLQDKFVVMYSGNLGRAHNLVPVLDACQLLHDDSGIQFLFIGEGVQKPRLRDIVRESGLHNVRFLTYQPKARLHQSLGAGHIHLVTMLPAAAGCLMPSKLYGILAAGRAVLAVCPADCDLARIVREHDVGIVVDPSPAESFAPRLAEAITQLRDDPARIAAQGQRARQLCLEQFDAPGQIVKFLDVLDSVLSPAPAPAAARAELLSPPVPQPHPPDTITTRP